MNKSSIFKKYTEQLDYVRLANGIYWIASILFCVSIYIVVFPPPILPTGSDPEMIGGVKHLVYKVKSNDEFTKAWYNALRYGIILLSAFSAGLFIKLWSYFYKNFSKKDFALFWFSLAMLSWSVAGIFKLAGTGAGWLTFLSQVNNLLFLTSLPFFKHGYTDILLPRLSRIGVREENYFRKIWLFFLIISLTCLPIFKGTDYEVWWKVFGNFLNLVISCLMGIMLLIVLWASFEWRRFNAIKWLSLLPITCLLVGEFSSFIYPFMPQDGSSLDIKMFGITVTKYDQEQVKFIAAFLLTMWMVTLMVLVAGLAMSWLYEQIDTQRREMTHLVKNSLHQMLLDLRQIETAGNKRTDNKALISRVENLRDFTEEVYMERGGMNIELHHFLDSTLERLGKMFKFKSLSWDFSTLDGLTTYGDPARNLGKLVTELVLNAYKYGDQTAVVGADLDDEVLTITIQDGGNPNFDFKAKAENNGLGMKLFDIYLEALDGSFGIFPKPNGKTLVLKFSKHKFIAQ